MESTLNATYDKKFEEVIGCFTPTTLALLSIELTDSHSRTWASSRFLDLVDEALSANVGEDEADKLRQWCRDNI